MYLEKQEKEKLNKENNRILNRLVKISSKLTSTERKQKLDSKRKLYNSAAVTQGGSPSNRALRPKQLFSQTVKPAAVNMCDVLKFTK